MSVTLAWSVVRRRRRTWILCAAFFVLALPVGSRGADDDLSLAAVCDRREATAGESVTVTVTGAWEGADGGKYVIREAAFPKLHNLELVSFRSAGQGAPSPRGSRFEHKLIYTFRAKEPGDAETGPIEVKYYRPEFKHEKVASADEKGEATAPLVRELPSIAIKVGASTDWTTIPLVLLGCASVIGIFVAMRFLRAQKKRLAA